MQSLASQVYAFLVTVLMGFTTGVLFDIYRVTKGVIRPGKIFNYLGDVVFWVISTLTVFLMLLIGNWGEIRFYVVLGAALGLLIYIKLFSRLVTRVLAAVLSLLQKLFGMITRLLRAVWLVITYPLVLARKIIIVPVGYISMAAAGSYRCVGRQAGRFIFGPVRRRADRVRNKAFGWWAALGKRVK